MTPCESALDYARRGWHVLPVHPVNNGRCSCGKGDCDNPGKHPRNSNGLTGATSDKTTIRRWWSKWPDANVGIAMRASGLMALDIDPRNGGDETEKALRAEYGALPKTLIARTGGGGTHILFADPGVELGGKLGKGIDVRHNAYIVVDPSVHVSGERYQWQPGYGPDDVQPAPMPEWLLNLLTRGERPAEERITHKPCATSDDRLITRASAYVLHATPAAEGSRNNSAFNLAGHLFAFKVDGNGQRLNATQVLDLLRPWNYRNAPPLSDAELLQVVNSASRNGTPRMPHEVRVNRQGDGGRTTGAMRPANLPGDTEISENQTAGPILRCMADIEARPISWLWPNRIPLDCVTLLVGRPGGGKSFLSTDISARVTTGSPWPDGSGNAPSGSVILISGEDDPHQVIRPRLDAHHADTQRVHLLSAVRRLDEDGKPYEVMFSLADVFALQAALEQRPDCRLLIVDPIGSFLGGKVDAHRDNEVRSVLAPVNRLAEKYGVAVLIVAHHRKSAAEYADDLVLGSRAFGGLARAVWHLATDPQNEDRRLLVPGKLNLCRRQGGLAFTIGGDPPRIWWERDPVNQTADQVLRNEGKRGPKPEAQEAAAQWLRDILAAGPMSVTDLADAAKAAGLSWRGGIRRAADDIGIRRHKRGFGSTGEWLWSLPGEPAPKVRRPPSDTNNPRTLDKPAHLSVFDPENADKTEPTTPQRIYDAHVPYVRENLRTYEPDASPEHPADDGCPVDELPPVTEDDAASVVEGEL